MSIWLYSSDVQLTKRAISKLYTPRQIVFVHKILEGFSGGLGGCKADEQGDIDLAYNDVWVLSLD